MCNCNICANDVEVINTFEEPVIIEVSQARAAVNGQSYFLTTQQQTVANNASIFLQITNPAGSGKVIHIGRIAGTASTSTIITFNRNGSFPAAGTPITPVNSNFSSASTSVVTAKFVNQVANPTVGGVIFQEIIQSGQGFTIIEYNGLIVMPSGTTFVIHLLNNSGGPNVLSLNVTFWETTL
ncbi:hypothetical protein D1872_205020 [compost metagenome]